MKIRLTYLMIVAMLCAVAGTLPAWAQLATVSGKVTDNDTPLPGVQVIYKNLSNGRTVKLKTDSKGTFFSVGVPIDKYNVTVVDATGKTIFDENQVVGESGGDANNILNIDITKGATAKGPAGAGGGQSGGGGKAGSDKNAPKVSKEEIEKIKSENTKIENINALITKYQAAVAAKDWQAAIPPLQGMVASAPTHWEYFQALGGAQNNTGDYEGSIQSFEKGIQAAQGVLSGAIPKDSHDPNMEPAKVKTGIGQMLAAEGNAYLKLKKNNEAVVAFTKAAEMDPNPGTAFFNLCATQYNMGNSEGAIASCDKAIVADPNRADAYFIKGSLLIASSTMAKDGKVVPAPGTAEALNKYLELAPDGPHATDVKQMLEYIGSKIVTSYKDRPTKKK